MMKSLCYVSASNWTPVLLVPSMSRIVVLGNTSPVTEMSVTTKGPFHSSRDVLLADHTCQLLLINETM